MGELVKMEALVMLTLLAEGEASLAFQVEQVILTSLAVLLAVSVVFVVLTAVGALVYQEEQVIAILQSVQEALAYQLVVQAILTY